MREIPIFVASSVREFEQGRKELSELLEVLNRVHAKRGVQLVWNRPETHSRTLAFGGKQLDFDAFIPISEFFILIIGQRVGDYTRHEYELALERFKRTRKPKILPCFLDVASSEADAFRKSIRKSEIGEQFVDTYQSFGDIKSQIRYELTNYVVNSADTGEEEAFADRGIREIIRKIHILRGEIEYLQALAPTPETITEIMSQYVEMARLVRKYKVEPDVLLDYMEFLWQQHLYSVGIEIGQCLTGFYTMENPGKDKWALLKNGLGLCCDEYNQPEQAERYYRDALEIYENLMKENPSDFASYAAITHSNLAVLLKNAGRMEEAEQHYQEALDIYRCLNQTPSDNFAPVVAMICSNLAGLRYAAFRPAEAEPYIREALSIYRSLAGVHPAAFEKYVAYTCNNLGALLRFMGRLDEAEAYLREALEIYCRLTEGNPGAFESKFGGNLLQSGDVREGKEPL